MTARGGLQWLQGLDTVVVSHQARHERPERRTRGAEPCDPPDAAREEPRWEDASGMVHDDGVDGTKEEPYERYCHCATDERGNEPDNYFQPDRERDVDEDDVALANLERCDELRSKDSMECLEWRAPSCSPRVARRGQASILSSVHRRVGEQGQ